MYLICSDRSIRVHVPTGQRALDGEDMRKVFTRLPQSRIPPMVEKARDWFILMFLLRGLPFVDLAYLRKNDLQGNVITYAAAKQAVPCP